MAKKEAVEFTVSFANGSVQVELYSIDVPGYQTGIKNKLGLFDLKTVDGQHSCACTNHTILAEALEKWPLKSLQAVLPEMAQIIIMLDELAKERFNNKTNGITFRRWSNPQLGEAITKRIGDGWKKNAEELKQLQAFNRQEDLQELLHIKQTAKNAGKYQQSGIFIFRPNHCPVSAGYLETVIQNKNLPPSCIWWEVFAL